MYFHLAAIPRRIERGTFVKSGDVIGLVGDTGVKKSAPHLHFAISIRPSPDREKYIDPEPLIALWPLRVPIDDGSERGLVTTLAEPGVPLGSMPADPGAEAQARRDAPGGGRGGRQGRGGAGRPTDDAAPEPPLRRRRGTNDAKRRAVSASLPQRRATPTSSSCSRAGGSGWRTARRRACARRCGSWRAPGRGRACRVIASATVAALVLVGGWTVWRHRAPQPRSIALSLGRRHRGTRRRGAGADVLRPGLAAHRRRLDVRVRSGAVGLSAARAGRAARRPSTIACSRPSRTRTGRCCRTPGACGVALGGQLWGEHVYAALDGVVDRARARRRRRARRRLRAHRALRRHGVHALLPPGGDPARRACAARASRPARSSAWSATPARAAKNRVRAPHLHFALSIRPSAELAGDVYWDPTPLMATWPLRVPPHGTVAGLVAATDTRRSRAATAATDHLPLPDPHPYPLPLRGARANGCVDARVAMIPAYASDPIRARGRRRTGARTRSRGCATRSVEAARAARSRPPR